MTSFYELGKEYANKAFVDSDLAWSDLIKYNFSTAKKANTSNDWKANFTEFERGFQKEIKPEIQIWQVLLGLLEDVILGQWASLSRPGQLNALLKKYPEEFAHVQIQLENLPNYNGVFKEEEE